MYTLRHIKDIGLRKGESIGLYRIIETNALIALDGSYLEQSEEGCVLICPYDGKEMMFEEDK